MKRAITKPHHDPSGGVSGADGTATFLAHPLFDELDRHFARFLERLAGGARPELALAAALVSHQRTDGGICLDLAAVAGRSLPTAAEKGPSVLRQSGPTETSRGVCRQSRGRTRA